MVKIKGVVWDAWNLLLDGYAVCVALLATHPHMAFWIIASLGAWHWVR